MLMGEGGDFVTVTNTYFSHDAAERAARQMMICRRCLLLLAARARR